MPDEIVRPVNIPLPDRSMSAEKYITILMKIIDEMNTDRESVKDILKN